MVTQVTSPPRLHALSEVLDEYRNDSSVYFLMYHDVRDDPDFFPRRYQGIRCFMTPDEFEYQLRFVRQHFSIISMEEARTAGNRSHSKPPCVLTFDDGLLDHHERVAPLLEKHGVQGTFFIPTALVNQFDLAPAERRLMAYHKIQFLMAGKLALEEVTERIFRILGRWRVEKTEFHRESRDRDQLWKMFSESTVPNNYWTPHQIFITRFLRSLDIERQREMLSELWPHCVDLPEYRMAQQLYLQPWMVRDLARRGHTVGGHGSYSYNLDLLEEKDALDELVVCDRELRGFGVEPLDYSYACGGAPTQAMEYLRKRKYHWAFGTRPRTDLDEESKKYYLPRINAPHRLPRELRIVLCGVHSQGLKIIQFLKQHNIPVAHVVTISESEAQRQKASGWVSYEQCQEWGIPVYYAKNYSFRHPDDVKFFVDHGFDVLFLGGWQRLIPKSVLDTLTFGGIGQHGSPDYLPKGRGRSPLNWSLINGNQRLIWNLFRMTPGIDDGEIVDFENVDITPWDTAETLYFKIETVVERMYLRTLPRLFRDECQPIPQSGVATFYPKRTPEDGKINWHGSMYEIHNLVRALTRPYPGAFTARKGAVEEKIMILAGQPFSSRMDFYLSAQYGEVVEVFKPQKFAVKCGEGLFLVTECSHTPDVGWIFDSQEPDRPLGLK